MRTINIGVAPTEEFKQYTLAIVRGEYKRKDTEPKLWVSSMERLGEVLSSQNRELMRIISKQKPKTMQELITLSGRQESELSSTLQTLKNFGFIKFKKTTSKEKIPVVMYDHFNVDMSLFNAWM